MNMKCNIRMPHLDHRLDYIAYNVMVFIRGSKVLSLISHCAFKWGCGNSTYGKPTYVLELQKLKQYNCGHVDLTSSTRIEPGKGYACL